MTCTDGTHSHPLSPIEDLGDGRTAVECTACGQEFVQEADGTLVPVVEQATGRPAADDRLQWLDWRRGGIGASDVPAILGLSPWASPWSVWAEKSGLLPLDDSDSPAMEFGRRAEPMVAQWFADVTGLHVVGEQTWLSHPEHPWLRCTVDGFVVESPSSGIDDALGVLEVKTTGQWRRWDEVPAYYQAQGQAQMLVSGLDRVWFPVLHGRRLEVYELKADPEDAALILARVGEFWHQHVLTGEPPELDGHDATLAALAALYPKHTPKESVAIDHAAAAVELLRDAKARAKAAEADEKGASAVIRWAMKDAWEGTVAGERALTLGTSTRKTTCKHCGETDESEPFRTLRLAKEATS